MMIRDRNPVAEALRKADEFNRRMRDADGVEHATLLEVGELTYGLSQKGFVHDLETWLADTDQQVEVGPFAYRTADPEQKARWWLDRVADLMRPVDLECAA